MSDAFVEAYAWISVAAESGDEKANNVVKKIRRDITLDEAFRAENRKIEIYNKIRSNHKK